MNIITMLTITELGIGGVITYSLYEPLAKKDWIRVKSLVNFFGNVYKTIGLLITFLGLCLVPFLNSIVGELNEVKESILIIYLLFLFNSSFSYLFIHKLSLLRAAQKDFYVVGYHYIISISQSIIQIIFLFLFKDYIQYLLIQLLGGIIYYLWLNHTTDSQFNLNASEIIPKITAKEKKKLFGNVWELSVGRIGGLLVNSTDNIIISYLINISSVGLLSNYTLLIKTIENFTSKILISISAGIGNYNSLEEKRKTFQLFKKLNFLIFSVYAWITVELFVVTNDIVKLFFGPNYVMNNSIVVILSINFFMVGMQSVIWTFRNSLGIFKKGQYLLLFTAILNLILSFTLGKIYGVFGILMATAIARLLTNWWYHPIILFRKGFDKTATSYFLTYMKYLSFLILIVSINISVLSYFQWSLILNIIAKITLSSLIFWLMFYLIFRKTKEFLFLIEKSREIPKIISSLNVKYK